MMSNILAHAELKIEWAYKHIERFESEIRVFHDTYSYKRVPVQIEGRTLSRLTDPPEIPPHFNLIIADAVHNTRVALDYLACALALLNGKSVSSVSFPVGTDSQTFIDECSKIKKLSDEAKSFIAALNPYKGGDNNLWALHELDRSDKHRKLVPLNEAAPMFYYTPQPPEQNVDGTTPYKYEVKLVPGFENLEGFEGQSALTLLKQFAKRVDEVLVDARARFFPGTQRVKCLETHLI